MLPNESDTLGGISIPVRKICAPYAGRQNIGSGDPKLTDLINTPRVINDGGVRIDVRPDELTVTPDPKAWQKKKSARWGRAFRFIVFGAFGLALLGRIAELNHPLEFLLTFGALIGLSYSIAMFAGQYAIHCTRDSFEVIKMVRGLERNRKTYPRMEIGQITYAPVSYSRYGAVNGIVFKAAGKKMKTLGGLDCPEAQTILKELDRLGFDVLHDVGMPMLVEMALERRNSWMNIR